MEVPTTGYEFKVGDTYRTLVAVWTVDYVSSNSMIRFRRDDGLTAWFSAQDFGDRVVAKERIDE